MKKFLSLLLVASVVSTSNAFSAPFDWVPAKFKRSSKTAPAKAVKKVVAPKKIAVSQPSRLSKATKSLTQAPKNAFLGIKNGIAKHPYAALVATVIAADYLARTYNKYYRENLAVHVTLGEKRKTAQKAKARTTRNEAELVF